MSGKSKVELTVEAVKTVIEAKKPTSMTKLAHEFGYSGSVSSGLVKKFRALIPEIDAMLKGATEPANGGDDGKPAAKPAKDAAKDKPEKPAKDKSAGKVTKSRAKQAKAKPAESKGGKWPHDERSPFREGSSYDKCVSIMISHPVGMPKERLVALLAAATGKDLKRSSFDVQVVCSAHGSAGEGLNPFEGPRNRSARFGYWVERKGDNVRLVLPERGAAMATKGNP